MLPLTESDQADALPTEICRLGLTFGKFKDTGQVAFQGEKQFMKSIILLSVPYVPYIGGRS